MNVYSIRCQRLQEKLQHEGINGCLVTHNVDILYFTGSFQNGYVFIPAEGTAIYYVRKSLERAMEEAQITVKALPSLRTFGEQLQADFSSVFAATPLNIATEFDVLPVQVFQKLRTVLPKVSWQDGSKLIREVRMIKSDQEIESIERAAQCVNEAIIEVLPHLEAGMTELELITKLESTLRLKGHAGLMHMRGFNQELVTGMVTSGAAAAKPSFFDGPAGGEGLSAAMPISASRKVIQPDEAVLIDIGCCINGYVIDQTRTAVIGDLDTELQRAYDVSEHILFKVEQRLKPGTLCEDLYTYALELANEAGLASHFMGYGANQVKFLGHGIGLEVDEWPVLAKGFRYPLEPGMVIAIEPKFTFPGKGVVGIEDTYLITQNGYRRLTQTKQALIRL